MESKKIKDKTVKEENSILMFLAGMLSGVVTGIVLGLLLAPKTGKEIREDIKGLSKDQALRVVGTVQERANRISSKLDELAKQSSDILIQDEIR